MPRGNWSFPCSPRNPAKVREELRLLRPLLSSWRSRGQVWSPRSGAQLEFGRLLRASAERPAPETGGEDLRFRRQTGYVSEENLRWTARARFGTYRFFGFALTDRDGFAALTEAGERFIDSTRPGDVLLRQLLKWQYPDFQHRGSRWPASEFAIYPFVAVARLVLELDGLTREEIARYCFTMRRTEDAAAVAAQIRIDRERRARGQGRVGKRLSRAGAGSEARPGRNGYDGVELRVAASTHDYADALTRSFRHTGLFSARGARMVAASGRERDLNELIYGDAEPAPSRLPASSLQLVLGEAPPVHMAQPRALFPHYDDHATFHAHYGDAATPRLPWEEPARLRSLAELLDKQVAALHAREAHLKSGRSVFSSGGLPLALPPEELERRVDTLRVEKQRLERSIFALESRTPQRLTEALDFFSAILRKEVIDPPTYLEWNAWRAFLALGGPGEIVPNLQLDDDLQPLNPAQGNQPDLTVDYGDFLVVCEVTLRSGADQRLAEARPVTRHVMEAQRGYRDSFGGRAERPVFGLFIAPRIHADTVNDFFVALKYRVIERQQIVVVPFTVRQFVATLRPFAGAVAFEPAMLRGLLERCVGVGLEAETGDEWLEAIEGARRGWLTGLGAPTLTEEPVARAVPLPLL